MSLFSRQIIFIEAAANAKPARDKKMRFVLREAKTKPRVIVYTNPSYLGADIDDSLKNELPVEQFDSSKNKLIGFEPEDKMASPEAKAKIKHMIAALKSGKKLPPMMIRKIGRGYQILDGHHRYAAYKQMGISNFSVQVIPTAEIKTTNEVPDEG